MLGDYVLHYPLTDFAVSLLAVAALIEIARVVLKRATWAHAVDLLLVLGFGGALAAVASGLWLTTVQHHPHTGALAIHHWFAYSTLGTSAIAVIARALQGRVPRLAAVKSGALLVSAALVTGAGFYGGKMAHGGESHHSDGATLPTEPHHAVPSPSDAGVTTSPPEDAMPDAGHHGSQPHAH